MVPWWLVLLGAVGLLSGVSPTKAQAADGNWRVEGAIAGRNFVLDCRFSGAAGVCVDAESGGKRSHPLESLATSGDRIAWSFKTRVMLASITLNFDGRVDGDRIKGSMRAAGRSGAFSAVRRGESQKL